MACCEFNIGDVINPCETEMTFWEYRSLLHDIPNIMELKFKVIDIIKLAGNHGIINNRFLLIIESIDNMFTITSNNNTYNSCFFKLDKQYNRNNKLKIILDNI